jgi:DNA-binding NtrC family response regulator
MTMSTARPKVLCVDDDPNVLEGLKVHLSRSWDVSTTTSGAAALDLLASEGGFAVVISDMRMPGMDGATLLRTIQERYPDTVRILLTGQRQAVQADTSIAEMNEGGSFRILTKPCRPQVLVSAVQAAVERYNRTVGA